MDTTTLILIAVAAGFALVFLLVMLNRAWGDFPARPAVTPTHLPPPEAPRPRWEEQPLDAEQPVMQQSTFATPSEAIPDLVPIQHPMILKAAESALQRGGDAARHLVRQGDQIYLSLQSIPDPEQRRMAWEMFRRFNAGEDFDMRMMFNVFRQIFRS